MKIRWLRLALMLLAILGWPAVIILLWPILEPMSDTVTFMISFLGGMFWGVVCYVIFQPVRYEY